MFLDWECCILCMIHRMKCQRWAMLKPQTQQPHPRTTWPWPRWTRQRCSPSLEKRYITVLFLLYELAEKLTFFFYCSCPPTRSSPKRLRSTNGRGSMRRPERRFLRWGRIFVFFTLASYLQGYGQRYANIGNVSQVMKQYSCPPHRKIVAEYEKTVAQMIGELVPPSGHCLRWRLELLKISTDFDITLLRYCMRPFSSKYSSRVAKNINLQPNLQ